MHGRKSVLVKPDAVKRLIPAQLCISFCVLEHICIRLIITEHSKYLPAGAVLQWPGVFEVRWLSCKQS